jgi:integrase
MAAPMTKTRHPGIYRRGSRYVVRYRAGGRRRSKSCRTLDEALKVKRAREAARDRGEFEEGTRLTLHEYAKEWVETYTGRGRTGFRESTREDYRRDLERWVLPFFGARLRVGEVTPRHLARLVAHLCEQEGARGPLTDAAVRKIVTPLRACLATAVEDGVIRSNPAQRVRLPYRPKVEDEDGEEVRALTRKQAVDLLRAIDPRYQLMFEVLLATGIRVSELLALQWRHVRFDAQPCVRVRRAIVRGRVEPPKTRYGKRDVPLEPRLVSDLRAWRQESGWPGREDPVFPSTTGTALHAGNVRRRILRPAAEKAGVPWAGFHSFRHTCASLLFDRGQNAVQVQRWLGHHDAAFTVRRYVHLLTEQLDDPLDLAAELWEGGSKTGPPPSGAGRSERKTAAANGPPEA